MQFGAIDWISRTVFAKLFYMYNKFKKSDSLVTNVQHFHWKHTCTAHVFTNDSHVRGCSKQLTFQAYLRIIKACTFIPICSHEHNHNKHNNNMKGVKVRKGRLMRSGIHDPTAPFVLLFYLYKINIWKFLRITAVYYWP